VPFVESLTELFSEGNDEKRPGVPLRERQPGRHGDTHIMEKQSKQESKVANGYERNEEDFMRNGYWMEDQRLNIQDRCEELASLEKELTIREHFLDRLLLGVARCFVIAVVLSSFVHSLLCVATLWLLRG
jgi:hypothetical protein